jgi:8-oxo-dGTP pyrophosphatase MutT (NUDIX family)
MIRCEPIQRHALSLSPASWDFAQAERKAIDAHWQRLVAANARLWNGEVLICTAAEVENGVLAARFTTTDFASFIAWRDWGWPDREARNCFGVPAVVSRDGELLMGIMAQSTLNAGRAYPPGGSLEPKDVRPDGSIDLHGSMAEEVGEETGLDLADARAGEYLAIFDGQRLAIVRRFDVDHSLADLKQAFAAHRARQAEPELDAIFGVRSRSQIDSRMPGYAQEIVRQYYSE